MEENFKFNKNKNIIWVHAVSVGEVNASVNLIRKLKKVFPNSDILVTTTTQTGSKRLKQVFDEEVFHQYLPFDVIYFVKSFLRYWKPHCLILIETEIWPNITEAKEKPSDADEFSGVKDKYNKFFTANPGDGD